MRFLPTSSYFVWHPSGPDYHRPIFGYAFADGRIPGAVNGMVAAQMQAMGCRVEPYEPGMDIVDWNPLETGGFDPVFGFDPVYKAEEKAPEPKPVIPADVLAHAVRATGATEDEISALAEKFGPSAEFDAAILAMLTPAPEATETPAAETSAPPEVGELAAMAKEFPGVLASAVAAGRLDGPLRTPEQAEEVMQIMHEQAHIGAGAEPPPYEPTADPLPQDPPADTEPSEEPDPDPTPEAPPPPPPKDYSRLSKDELRAECEKRRIKVSKNSIPKMLSALEAADAKVGD